MECNKQSVILNGCAIDEFSFEQMVEQLKGYLKQYVPETDLDEGIIKTLKWYKKNI